MGIFSSLKNGWSLGKTSLITIKENPSLMLFPVISGASLIMVLMTFFGGGFYIFGDLLKSTASSSAPGESGTGDVFLYIIIFLFYLINYFVIVFFNVGLVHCARLILAGKQTNFVDGVNFALSRIGTVFAWAVLAATVGLLLNIIQNKAGKWGKVITGMIGAVWSIATFFVVPILAYEDVNPIDAVKRSGKMMKDTWGESLGATFSFGIFTFLGTFLIALPLGFLFGLIHPGAGIVAGVLIVGLIQISVSAANVVFLAAVYQNVHGEPIGNFDGDTLDSIFIEK